MAKIKIQAAPSIRRLPSYLHIVKQADSLGLNYISGTVIAEELHLEPIQVRKDLAITGITGKPKKGYPVKDLIKAIEFFLGWDKSKKAVIVGAGNLGTALCGYKGFRDHGLEICAAFDIDIEKIGTKIHNIEIYDRTAMADYIKKFKVKIAILTSPRDCAQEAADILVKAGIKAIWNFTNAKIRVPENVAVEEEDLTSGYAMLGVMINAAGC